MLSKYFTKVEDRFVFNISLIFWHLLVLLAGVAMAIGILVFAWSLIPTRKAEVNRQPNPEKRAYPELVKVDLSELIVVEPEPAKQTTTQTIQVEPTVAPAYEEVAVPTTYEDTAAFRAYQEARVKLTELVPPTLGSWEGAAHYIYPMGERFWNVYKDEKYRKRVVTEPSVNDKIDQLFALTNAANYTAKYELLNAVNILIAQVPEGNRYNMLQFLLGNSSGNWKTNKSIYIAVAPIPSKLGGAAELAPIKGLISEGIKNPNEGVALAGFLSSLLDSIHFVARVDALKAATDGYRNLFKKNLVAQKEATALFLELAGQMEPDKQAQYLRRYYELYLHKNEARRQEIVRIDNEHAKRLRELEANYLAAERSASMNYQVKKAQRSEWREKAMYAVGGAILLVVLVAVLLVFLSIQRLVKKIEAKMP